MGAPGGTDPVRLIGVLVWYDESPHWLATSVAGAARVCDAIVAVDGAFALYPGGRPRSHPQQVEAITQTAEAMGVGCLVYQPQEVWWGNEVEKRSKSLALAGALAEEGDWLLAFDADYHLLRCNPDSLRHDLAETDLLVASYQLLEGADYLATPELERVAAELPIETDWMTRTPDIFRWSPQLRYVGNHYTVTDGERILRGAADVNAEPCLHLDSLAFYHRTSDRARTRRDAAKTYYENRDAYQVEVA